MDITELAPTITWSGDYQQRARSLDFGLLSSATDKSIPTVKCELGNAVTLMEGNTTLFEGYVFTRQKGTESSIIDIGCFDRGFYLKSKASYKFTNVTPEAITRRICTDFGISAGEIVSTGFKTEPQFFGVQPVRYCPDSLHFGFRTDKEKIPLGVPRETALRCGEKGQ